MSDDLPEKSQPPDEAPLERKIKKAIKEKGAVSNIIGGLYPMGNVLADHNAAMKKALGGISTTFYGGGPLSEALHKGSFGSILGNAFSGASWAAGSDGQVSDTIRKMVGENQTRDLELESKVTALRQQAREQADLIRQQAENSAKSEETIEELNQTVARLDKIREIQYLLTSVSPEAGAKIYEDEEFRNKFTSNSQTYVVSVDIRRSTELMLKSKNPKAFAEFVTTLCGELVDIFKRNVGVVDKFTGDGILAFFPDFYSGHDAGYFALKSATEANEAFRRLYRKFRSSFTVILDEVGLGIGIDYGEVQLVQVAGALTIVGNPVVYACRMGGAPAGRIYLNQGAYDEIDRKYPHLIQTKETTLSIKGDGALLAYDVNLTERPHTATFPEWLEQPKADS